MYSLLRNCRGLFIDIQSLRYTPIFQILSYLGHQLYTYLDRCYIEGEFVDFVSFPDLG